MTRYDLTSFLPLTIMLPQLFEQLLAPRSRCCIQWWNKVFPKWMLKDAIVAPPSFNRWLVPPAAIATHLCIGSVYAWSMFNGPLARELGVVAPAADDWSLSAVVPIFSTAIVCLGLSAAVAGKWLEEVGPRTVGTVSALCWGGGFGVSALGIELHSLPLIYLGTPASLPLPESRFYWFKCVCVRARAELSMFMMWILCDVVPPPL